MNNLGLLMNFLGKERASVETSQAQPTKKQGRKNPIKMLSFIGFFLSLFTICLSSGAAEAARARVNAPSGLNVRSGPSRAYRNVYDLSNGQRVNTTGRFSNGWAQLSNGYWVANRYLNYGGGTGGGSRTGTPRTARVTAINGLNVRSGPNTAYRNVYDLSNGQRVSTTGRFSNGWAQLSNGYWVANRYLNYGGGGTGGGTRSSLLRRISSRTGGANIRSGPSTNNRRLAFYNNGTPLTLTGRTQNGWYELTRGRGWIAGNLVR
ncbi:MAG: SH3 domain-containing protein [Cyanobacteria bacterium P01_D01_bin.116]